LRVHPSVWRAREKHKINLLITELLQPPGGVDAVEHAKD